jgi:hypothetical protein
MNLYGNLDGRCNNILWNCKGEECDYHYEDDKTTACPLCQTPREYCSKYPVKGKNGKCGWHGGKALVGVSHPGYKGKGLSKHLPTRMLEHFQLAIDDPDILAMDEGIALLKSRRNDLITRAEESASGEMWKDMRKKFQEFTKARKTQNAEKMADTLYDLEVLIARGHTDYLVWQEILDIEERVRRLASTEMQRRKLAETIITEDQFKTLLGYIVNSIQTRVKDKNLKMDLLADIAKLNA